MAMQKLCIQQGFGLLDEGQQDFGRDPQLAFEDAANRLGHFFLPALVQFHETVDAPAKETYFFGVMVVARRKKRQELAAGRRGAAAPRKRPQIGVQGTRVQNEKPGSITLADGFRFTKCGREDTNSKIFCVRHNSTNCPNKQWMRTHNLHCDSHARCTLLARSALLEFGWTVVTSKELGERTGCLEAI